MGPVWRPVPPLPDGMVPYEGKTRKMCRPTALSLVKNIKFQKEKRNISNPQVKTWDILGSRKN